MQVGTLLLPIFHHMHSPGLKKHDQSTECATAIFVPTYFAYWSVLLVLVVSQALSIMAEEPEDLGFDLSLKKKKKKVKKLVALDDDDAGESTGKLPRSYVCYILLFLLDYDMM